MLLQMVNNKHVQKYTDKAPSLESFRSEEIRNQKKKKKKDKISTVESMYWDHPQKHLWLSYLYT